MTGLTMHEGTVAPSGDWPADAVAYADREWTGYSLGEVPALIVRDGMIHWGDTHVPMPDGQSDDTVALACLLAVAHDAVSALGSAKSVTVTGGGVVAWLVRRICSGSATPPGSRPDAVVDTTGDASVLVESSHSPCDGGTLVLAGESLGRACTINLYTDVHRRGLTLVGVRPPLAGGSLEPHLSEAIHLRREQPPRAVTFGARLGEATWYRFAR
jgi:threonine dehydrogenase-like Zn-dependent dehydrogenase